VAAELVLCFDQFELDCSAMLLRYAGQLVPAEPTSVGVLAALLRNQGQLLSRAELLRQVWPERSASDNALSVAMTRLRGLLCDYGLPRDCVTTLYGRGYCFTGKVPVRVVTSRSRAARSDRAPFIGRERVLEELTRALSAASVGFGSLVALRGAHGIGKTRTAETFAKQALRAGCVVHWISCAAGDGKPSWWLPDELRRCMKVADLRTRSAPFTYQLDPHARYDLFEGRVLRRASMWSPYRNPRTNLRAQRRQPVVRLRVGGAGPTGLHR
jgi:DNA-binding winged helix-turn-helix (wHTH) protein